jgi:P4 family phage/plasmid primase-like protien
MHKAAQVILREKVLAEIPNIWDDLQIINSWNDVIDEGVTKGQSPWQLLGSRKPHHQAYMLKQCLIFNYDESSGWTVINKELSKFSIEKNMHKLSARYNGFPLFPVKAEMQAAFEAAKLTLGTKSNENNGNKKARSAVKVVESSSGAGKSDYSDITDEKILDERRAHLFDSMCAEDYKLKEADEYLMALPKAYYGPGSYTKWISCLFALKNTSPKLFLSALKFSCQEGGRKSLAGPDGKFDWKRVPELYDLWQKMTPDGKLKVYSLMYWCKNDAPEKYNEIRMNSIEYFINDSIKTKAEFDIARVLRVALAGQAACVSIKNKRWYWFQGHRWVENDSGMNIRLYISQDLHKMYAKKMSLITTQLAETESTDPKIIPMKEMSKKLADICLLLKKNDFKNKIMNEIALLCYDGDFPNKLDKNPYLLCFNNGVIDFEQKSFRKGRPDDFISKTTNINYKISKNPGIVRQISEFMTQLFPEKELETYMWNKLASVLIGVNFNQTFDVYLGPGANGKSILVKLMAKSLGEYSEYVPITLITEKRLSIGSSSSEIAKLNGVRYAVMSEPTKGDKIKEGQLKELTGGDSIHARQLFQEAITFVPMFKLVVTTNTDFSDTSNDDGTWRRMRYIPFKAKFLERPYEDEKYPRSECPYQYPLDKTLENKLDTWTEDFMSMLVDITYEKKGLVSECSIVSAYSDVKREEQDYMAAFIKQKIQRKEGSCIKKAGLIEDFKKWYELNFKKTVPQNKEIIEYMNQRFGVYTKAHHWRNIEFIKDEVEEDEMDAVHN